MSFAIIKPTRPVIDVKAHERAIQNALTAAAKGMQVDFGVTTQTWRNRPAFDIKMPAPYERTVSTNDDIYAMLDAGTKAHDIRPRRTRILRFATPFRSKTLPNQIMSRAGSTGSTEVVARTVHHPGTKARRWAKAIQKKWQAQVGSIFQRAIDGA